MVSLIPLLGQRKCKGLDFGSNVRLEMSNIRFVCCILLEFQLESQSLETVFNEGRSYGLDLDVG
jgi:hypothetical protein